MNFVRDDFINIGVDEWNTKIDKYFENQIVYGRKEDGGWLFDAIFKYGSYGKFQNLLETYGEYGQKDGEPMVMSAEDAFAIISRLERERKETDDRPHKTND